MLKILIADDHAVLRRGLKHIILEEYPSAKVGEVAETEALIAEVMNNSWDIVICDLSMPGRSGLDALIEIKQMSPQLPVLIMSMYPESQFALRVLKAGASGFLGKESIHDHLIRALQTVQQGRKFITPSIAEKLADAVHENNPGQEPHHMLSARELQVCKLLATGKSVSEISTELSLSTTTVSTYRARIMVKLKAHSNADLTRYAVEWNLI